MLTNLVECVLKFKTKWWHIMFLVYGLLIIYFNQENVRHLKTTHYTGQLMAHVPPGGATSKPNSTTQTEMQYNISKDQNIAASIAVKYDDSESVQMDMKTIIEQTGGQTNTREDIVVSTSGQSTSMQVEVKNYKVRQQLNRLKKEGFSSFAKMCFNDNTFCNGSVFTNRITPTHICKLQHNSKYITLVIMITSTTHHYLERDHIRQSWASSSFNNTATRVRHVFLLGKAQTLHTQKAINEEYEEHGDLLVGDFVDNYRNLTLKTMMGLRWFTTYCEGAKFLLKADDDIFVNIISILTLLELGIDKFQSYVIGHCQNRLIAIHDNTSKWYISKQSYNHTHFPPYCQGPGFILGGHIARDIANTMHKQMIIPLEDVFVGLVIQNLHNKTIMLSKYLGFVK